MATIVDCDYSKNVCLLLLIGIPGSGKTFFTNFLVNHFTSDSENSSSFLSVVPVTYDNFVTEECYMNGWKQQRKMVFDSVEQFVSNVKKIDSLSNINEFNVCPIVNHSVHADKNNLLIVIDDNMYYKSMRYDYYRLAKKYETSFCQVYLKTTPDVAKKYNQRRSSVVPDHVISRMYEKLEPPNPELNVWEHNSITISAFEKFDTEVLEKLHKIIWSALSTPETHNDNTSSLQDRVITDKNVMHQIDIRLRSLIGSRVKEINSSTNNKTNVKCAANELNCKRLRIMNDIKCGHLILPQELVEYLQCANRTNVGDNTVNNFLMNILFE